MGMVKRASFICWAKMEASPSRVRKWEDEIVDEAFHAVLFFQLVVQDYDREALLFTKRACRFSGSTSQPQANQRGFHLAFVFLEFWLPNGWALCVSKSTSSAFSPDQPNVMR